MFIRLLSCTIFRLLCREKIQAEPYGLGHKKDSIGILKMTTDLSDLPTIQPTQAVWGVTGSWTYSKTIPAGSGSVHLVARQA